MATTTTAQTGSNSNSNSNSNSVQGRVLDSWRLALAVLAIAVTVAMGAGGMVYTAISSRVTEMDARQGERLSGLEAGQRASAERLMVLEQRTSGDLRDIRDAIVRLDDKINRYIERLTTTGATPPR